MNRFVRKQRGWWLVSLLPVLLRLSIPVGFMPMVGPDHRWTLVVCDGYAAVPPVQSLAMQSSPTMTADMPMDAPMAMLMDMPMDAPPNQPPGAPVHGDPAHQDRGNCPYGSAPVLGALSGFATLVSLLIERSSEPALAVAQVAYFEVSPRAHSPRGPPRSA